MRSLEPFILRCVVCGAEIEILDTPPVVECPVCGARYLYKARSGKYVYAGGGESGNDS